jgi:Cyclic nucleotide-binding domain
MTDPTLPLPGLSPVSGKTVITKFDGGLWSQSSSSKLTSDDPFIIAHGALAAENFMIKYDIKRLRFSETRDAGGRVMPTKCRSSFDPKAFLAKVGEGRSINRYRKDKIVFSQGDPADAVFYIERGEVKFTVVSEQGKEAVVAILGTNQFFGEGCLAGQAQRIATVVTMTDSVIVRLEKAAIVCVI